MNSRRRTYAAYIIYNSSTLSGHKYGICMRQRAVFFIFLKVVRLSLDFMWNGNEFQIFGPKYLILLTPRVTSFMIAASRLSLC